MRGWDQFLNTDAGHPFNSGRLEMITHVKGKKLNGAFQVPEASADGLAALEMVLELPSQSFYVNGHLVKLVAGDRLTTVLT